MDDVLAELKEAHAHVGIALDILEKRRDESDFRENLRSVSGTLNRIVSALERERARWVN